MRRVNCIIVIHPDRDKLLFCLRSTDPYKGLYNFVGGKIEPGELSENAAYRELFEETGISRNDIELKPFMDYVWYFQDLKMEVYAGSLSKDVKLCEEKHKLAWIDIHQDYFDMGHYAGEGNIGHMVEILKQSKLIL